MNLAIVAVHYGLPETRLVDFLMWNEAHAEALDAHVFVVSEKSHAVPGWATSLVFPRRLEIFSITQTANYGIRAAIDSGAGVVVKTDIDCILDGLDNLAVVSDGLGAWAPYRMVATPSEPGRIWNQGRGTIALTAGDWERVNGYDERMSGYGVDDGDLTARARRLGIRWRQCPPIRHVSGTGEIFRGPTRRQDRWNYGTANPLNRKANHAVKKTPWARADWGKF